MKSKINNKSVYMNVIIDKIVKENAKMNALKLGISLKEFVRCALIEKMNRDGK